MQPANNEWNPWYILVEKGDRVVLDYMGKDPNPIPPGTLGTVICVTDLSFLAGRPEQQISVNWDNGRSLSCICPPDILRRVPVVEENQMVVEHTSDFRWRPAAIK